MLCWAVSVERAPTLSFLDAAEVVLRDAGVPMSPQEILERAVHLGLVTTNGATPSQTMKSKLSVDVLERHEGSRFMRSDPNRFALRSWKPAITEFFADRFQKALLDEEVVVFGRELLEVLFPEPGLRYLASDESDMLISHTYPMQRREAEENFDVIQLVSQFLVVRRGTIATYKRTKRLPEARLHGVYSMLFGGHLNPEDVPPLFSVFDPQAGPSLIQRELSEELRFSSPPSLSLVGAIYDPRTEVSTQHLGVLYEVHPAEDSTIEIGERGFLMDLRFETPEMISDRLTDFENWSELVLRTHVKGSLRTT